MLVRRDYPVLTLPPKHPIVARPFVESYSEKVLNIQRADLIAYWRLTESSGTVADNYEGTAARDGTYNQNVSDMGIGDGIGDGNTAPVFTPGSSNRVTIDTSSLDTAFDGAECTLAGWFKMRVVGIWTDGSQRAFMHVGVNTTTDLAQLSKSTTNNTLRFRREGGNVADQVQDGGHSETVFVHVAMTVSESTDEMKAYVDGTQVGSTQTGLGAYTGALGSSFIGSRTNVGEFHDGRLAHFAIWTAPLTVAKISSLATV